MKRLLITLFVAVPFSFFAQENISDDAKYENALFQHTALNKQAVSTSVSVINTAFTDDEFRRLKKDLMTKDGIFKVELTDLNRTVKVYYFTDISSDDLKQFFYPYREKFEMSEQEEFQF